MAESETVQQRRSVVGALGRSTQDPDAFVFVDFDHTLLSGNSTEIFLASCKPALVVALVEFLVRRCIPWRLTGLDHWFRLRDFSCCLAVRFLFPWNAAAWGETAPDLFLRTVNRNVGDELDRVAVSRVVIVTFGMEFIVRALLRGSKWEHCPLVATPTRARLAHFRAGKLALLKQRFGVSAVERATVITDSLDDEDILRAARHGVLIEPRGTGFEANQRLYIPLRYTLAAKYPPFYVLDQVLMVEIAILIISVSPNLSTLCSSILYVPLLTISLMSIYEIGYFENDMFAAKREKTPTLTDNVDRFRSYPIQPAAWVWAIVTGVLGILLARWLGVPLRFEDKPAILIWITTLILLRVTFFCYNRLSVSRRQYAYPLLQAFKYVPVFILVDPTIVGLALTVSQIAMISTVYFFYRSYGVSLANVREVVRTGIFVVSLLVIFGTLGSAAGGGLTVALALTWSAVRLAKSLVLMIVRSSRRALTFRIK